MYTKTKKTELARLVLPYALSVNANALWTQIFGWESLTSLSKRLELTIHGRDRSAHAAFFGIYSWLKLRPLKNLLVGVPGGSHQPKSVNENPVFGEQFPLRQRWIELCFARIGGGFWVFLSLPFERYIDGASRRVLFIPDRVVVLARVARSIAEPAVAIGLAFFSVLAADLQQEEGRVGGRLLGELERPLDVMERNLFEGSRLTQNQRKKCGQELKVPQTEPRRASVLNPILQVRN